MGRTTKLLLYVGFILCACQCVQGEDCQDGHRETQARLCQAWEEHGYCTDPSKEKIMRIICRKTCKFCISSHWSDWSSWGACSVSCATGVRTKSRICLSSDPDVVTQCRRLDGSMSPYESTSETCNSNKCPDCKDIELEAGCKTWAEIGFCQFHEKEMRKWCARSCKFCSDKLEGRWDEWSDWTTCPVTCGGGMRRRSRVCISPNVEEPAACLTKRDIDATFEVETEACNTEECSGCKEKNRQPDTQMCQSWKEAGYCKIKEREMSYWCAKTCGCDN